MPPIFRKQYDGLPLARRVFGPLEQIDEVERAGYRSTKQMVESLLAAGQRLVEFRATEFAGDMNPGPFQGSPDQVDLDAKMQEVVESGEAAVGRVRAATKASREAAHRQKVEEAKAFLEEAQSVASPAPSEGNGPS